MSEVGEIPTPFLVIDQGALERNLAEMAAVTARAGLSLRPHAKTHKCPAIARRQLELGAVGLSVATVGEAEVFARHGVTDLFVAFPVWAGGAGGELARRLAALADQCRLRVGVDSAAGAAALGRVRSASGGAGPLEVLIEIDCGHHRSGVAPGGAPEVARAAERSGLWVVGVFSFPGHSYAPGMPGQAAADEVRALQLARAALSEHGFEIEVSSGGSTPTAHLSAARPDGLTELRPGVYVFHDAQQVQLGTCRPEQVALWAVSTVVSTPAPGRIILDAGSKILGADRPAWVTGHGMVREYPDAVIEGLWEHHAVVTLSDKTLSGETRDGPPPRVGDRLTVVPNHVCTAVNLVDELVVAEGDLVVDRWPVAARGANS